LTANALRSPPLSDGQIPKILVSSADITALGIAAGDYLLVGSRQAVERRDLRGDGGEHDAGRDRQVLSVDQPGGVITLRSILNDTYNTADGAFIYKVTFLSGVFIEGIGWDNTTPQTGTKGFVAFSQMMDSVVRDCIMRDGDERGVYRFNCIRTGVEDCHFYDFMGNAGNGSAYGVSDFNACQENWVRGCTGHRMWNVTTTNGQGEAGIPRSNVYDSCTSWQAYNNGFSAHEEGELNVYRNLKSFGGSEGTDGFNATAGSGMSVRVNNAVVQNFTAIDCNRYGFWYRGGFKGLIADGVVVRQQHQYSAGGSSGIRLEGDTSLFKNAVIDGVDDDGIRIAGNDNYIEALVRRTGLQLTETPTAGSAVKFASSFWTGLTGTAATDVFTLSGHGLLNNTPVWFSARTGGAGITDGQIYYIINATANTFQVSATVGGAALNFTTDLTAAQLDFGARGNTVNLTAVNCPGAVNTDTGVPLLNRVFIEDLVSTPIGQTTWVQQTEQSFDVKAASPRGTNVSVASAPSTLDGYTMVAGDRVLLKDQTTATENGPWIFNGAAAALTRPTDLSAKVVTDLSYRVNSGTDNSDTTWEVATTGAIVLGTTSLRISQRGIEPSMPTSSPSGLGPMRPTSARLENMNRFQIALSNQAALATGTIRVFPMGLIRAGHTMSALNLWVAATASATITNSWAGIARFSDRVILAISATSTSTTAANTLKTFTFGSAFTAPKDEVIVGFVMYQATTVPSLAGINAFDNLQVNGPVINGTSGTGQTTPPAVGTALAAFTADTEIPYAFLT
jgi:hypothetical protein